MANKKKILFLHQTLRQGGTSRQILYLYEGLDRELFNPVFVIFEKDKIFYRQILAHHQVWILKEHGESYVKCLIKFIDILKHEKPDCIQTFNPSMTHFVCIVSLFSSTPPLFAGIRNRNLNLKKILFNILFKSRFKKVIVNSNDIKHELMKKSFMRNEKIKTIYNTIDTNRFSSMSCERIKDLRARFHIDPDDFLVLSIGRIHKQKNIMCTMRALVVLKDKIQDKNIKMIHLGLRQDKKLFRKILRFIESHGIADRCSFMDPVLDVGTFYNMADVVVLSSLWEGLPNVVLEAMACERLIIAADSADRDHIIDDGVTGYKFRRNDDHELASLLVQVMALDEADKRRMGKSARRDIMRRFATGVMVREFQSMYSALE